MMVGLLSNIIKLYKYCIFIYKKEYNYIILYLNIYKISPAALA